MTILNEIAEMLDGSKYPFNTSVQEAKYAKDHGVVIVYGASDDLIEFSGAIYDEDACYDGGTVFINRSGIIRSKCDNEKCIYFRDAHSNASTIEAIWDRDGYSWMYETDIPHETFDILEDGEKYCRGIVFMLDDVVGES